jgi:NADPH2:quinone reductase
MFGRIVIIGSRGSLQFTPRQAMTKDATIYGMSFFNSSDDEREEIHTAIYDGLSRGFLAPVIRESMPLADSPRAHHDVIGNKSLGKIVLIP